MKNIKTKNIINCPLCKKNKTNIIYDFNKYKILKCKNCGFCYLSPRPVSAEELYKNDYFDEKYSLEKSDFQEINKKINENKAMIKNVLKFKKNGEFLEIGSNYGFFLAVASANGFNTTGVEINSRCAEFAEKVLNLKIVNENIENVNFPEKKFDVIFMSHVLEHFDNVIDKFKKINSWLKDDGIIVIKVPDFECLESKRDKEKYRGLSVPYHYSHFTLKTLKKLANIISLKVIFIDIWIDYKVSEKIFFMKKLIKKQNEQLKFDSEKLNIPKVYYKEDFISKLKHFIKTKLLFYFRGRSITVIMKKK
ncbi:MAG: class I SAM-dependent methyltransferase [Candidatus Muirbacterium halophilum]|nr:class I SAM-dependent methyltransferase [Candidatus Muirbacterium halophilum]MCK9474946.1 class I SAM-dependent methyltransferase [Candidatus Muirbacterium halophilum]